MKAAVVVVTLALLAANAARAQDAAPTVEASVAQGWQQSALEGAHTVNVVMTGIQAGWLLGTKLWVSPIRERQSGEDWIELQGSLNQTVGSMAPFMMGSSALANTAPLIIDGLDLDVMNLSFVLASAGFVLNSTIIATTLIGNVPVNDVTEAAYVNGTVPSNYVELRNQWETYHTARVVLSVAALALNATAAATLEE